MGPFPILLQQLNIIRGCTEIVFIMVHHPHSLGCMVTALALLGDRGSLLTVLSGPAFFLPLIMTTCQLQNSYLILSLWPSGLFLSFMLIPPNYITKKTAFAVGSTEGQLLCRSAELHENLNIKQAKMKFLVFLGKMVFYLHPCASTVTHHTGI